MFWTPAFAGVTHQETFYETIKIAECGIRNADGREVFDLKVRSERITPGPAQCLAFLRTGKYFIPPSSLNGKKEGGMILARLYSLDPQSSLHYVECGAAPNHIGFGALP
jgi:hypothetical protein